MEKYRDDNNQLLLLLYTALCCTTTSQELSISHVQTHDLTGVVGYTPAIWSLLSRCATKNPPSHITLSHMYIGTWCISVRLIKDVSFQYIKYEGKVKIYIYIFLCSFPAKRVVEATVVGATEQPRPGTITHLWGTLRTLAVLWFSPV